MEIANPVINPARVLVVDDEPSITDAVGTALRYEGFAVADAATGRAALRQTIDFRPDLIVLDVMLPDIDGLEVIRQLRADGCTTPVIFLSARDDTEAKIIGLTAGGDDYVTKPFSLGEIIARVHAILRRTSADDEDDRSILRFQDLTLDEETHEVWRNEIAVHLTATEFSLLRYFMMNPRRVLSRAQIHHHVWADDFDDESNVVESFISSLRKKLHRLGPPLLHTVRGVGYALRQPDE